MVVLTIGVLKKVIENMPDDFEVAFNDGENILRASDDFELNLSSNRLILKKY